MRIGWQDGLEGWHPCCLGLEGPWPIFNKTLKQVRGGDGRKKGIKKRIFFNVHFLLDDTFSLSYTLICYKMYWVTYSNHKEISEQIYSPLKEQSSSSLERKGEPCNIQIGNYLPTGSLYGGLWIQLKSRKSWVTDLINEVIKSVN